MLGGSPSDACRVNWLRLQANYDLAEVRRHAHAFTVRKLAPRRFDVGLDAGTA